MNKAEATLPLWHLEGAIASQAHGDQRLFVDTRDPGQGLCVAASASMEQIRVLAVHCRQLPQASWKPTDLFVRRGDLVVSYDAGMPPSLQMQLAWRTLPSCSPVSARFEQVVSVQAPRDELCPDLAIVSHFPAGEVCVVPDDAGDESLHGNSGVVLARPDQASVSFALLLHPTELRRSSCAVGVAASPAPTATFRLFDERLEKGVLRRARMRFLVLNRDNDTAVAVSDFGRFRRSPMPLTT